MSSSELKWLVHQSSSVPSRQCKRDLRLAIGSLRLRRPALYITACETKERLFVLMLGQQLENLRTRIIVARVLAVVVCLSVCSSVTSRCFTEMAKRRITQTTPHYSPGTRVFLAGAENLGKTQAESSQRRRHMQVRYGAVAGNWRLSTRSVVNL